MARGTERPTSPDLHVVVRKTLTRGRAYTVTDRAGETIGHASQDGYRPFEPIDVLTRNGTSADTALDIRAWPRKGLSVTHAVRLGDGSLVATLTRHRMRSLLLESWRVSGRGGKALGTLAAPGGLVSARVYTPARWLGPTLLHARLTDGTHIATIRAKHGWRSGTAAISILVRHEHFDELVLLAAACLHLDRFTSSGTRN